MAAESKAAVAAALFGNGALAILKGVAFESYSLLLGETAPAGVKRSIDRVIDEERAVRGVRDLRTMHRGPQSLLVVMAVEFAPRLDTAGIADAVSRLHGRLGDVLKGITAPELIVIEPAPSDERARRVA